MEAKYSYDLFLSINNLLLQACCRSVFCIKMAPLGDAYSVVFMLGGGGRDNNLLTEYCHFSR